MDRIDNSSDLLAHPSGDDRYAPWSTSRAALHSSEAALDWLVSIVADADRASAELGAYRNNTRLRERLGAVIAEHDDPRLCAAYAKAFPLKSPGE